MSLGPRGATVSVGTGGVDGNVGLPWTGLSVRENVGRSTRRQPSAVTVGTAVTISLDDQGKVQLLDEAGAPLPPRVAKLVRDQKGDHIRQWLEQKCDLWNEGIERILGLHLSTPSPNQPLRFEPHPFPEAAPTPPAPAGARLPGLLLRSYRERIERENTEAREQYEQRLDEWHARKAEHESTEEARREAFEVGRLRDAGTMEAFLEHALTGIEWPRETLISFQLEAEEAIAFLDIGLPAVGGLPTQHSTVASRGFRISVRDKSKTQIRREYAQHIHGVLFRAVGEVFSVLPTVSVVVVSGYSQRADAATGQIRDEYLVSARVARTAWGQIDFSNLESVDLPTAFEQFELRRKMTKTGIFRAIEPFDRTSAST